MSSFFKNVSKVDKPLAKLTKRKREKTKIFKIRDEKRDIAASTSKIQRITR
jgi:hypothetical protein